MSTAEIHGLTAPPPPRDGSGLTLLAPDDDELLELELDEELELLLELLDDELLEEDEEEELELLDEELELLLELELLEEDDDDELDEELDEPPVYSSAPMS